MVTDVISKIKSHHKVFIQGAAATPIRLIRELALQAHRLQDVTIYHLHTEFEEVLAKPEYQNSFKIHNFFLGSNIRPYLDYNHVDYIPCFLSEIPQLFRKQAINLDVAIIQVSPPDQHGFCSLGTSVDVTKAAVDCAKIVLAEINQKMPRVHGDGLIHISKIHGFIEVSEELPQARIPNLTDIDLKIGQNVASLVENRSTIQVGIGNVPNAVLQALSGHQDLGLHTEMWSDGVLDLIKQGIITNRYKTVHPGKNISSFIMGTQKVYDFIHDNPSVVQLESSYVNDPVVISRNSRAVAINSAVEIDLTGQVCADSIGARVISGVGGQMDFIRGSAMSREGKPIFAMTSRSPKGHPRITVKLKPGAGVVTTRAHVHYVVTEYGAVNLYGQSIRERARLLISIAHPEDRESLEKGFQEFYCT